MVGWLVVRWLVGGLVGWLLVDGNSCTPPIAPVALDGSSCTAETKDCM